MKYKWLIKESYNFDSEFKSIAYGSETIAKLLINRGIDTKEKALEYLNPEKYTESSPYEIPDLEKAKKRIFEAIDKNQKIVIFGDYDVDGVTSTSCLLLTLKEYTKNVDFYIPNRLSEGYGLNKKAVEKFGKNKIDLLITCDCGVTNTSEIELANSLGIDVIVTDHHSLPEVLPPAIAVLNPQLLPDNHKLKSLPGVGVAYKLAEAILEERKLKSFFKEDLLDLVTLGMIADLAKLVDENRYLVQIGLPRLAYTKKIGLKELLRICGFKSPTNSDSKIDTEHVGFGIAPRINAVGRLTDANQAVRLFTTTNEIEAIHIATELDIQNKERQIICEQTYNEAFEILENNLNPLDKCIVLAKEGWHHGVVGIVASRILEKYHLPTILIAITKNEELAKGSGRSIDALNMIEALHKSNESLEKYGGHMMACGLALKPENIERFKADFSSTVSSMLEDKNIEATLKIDAEIDLNELNIDFITKINSLAPFGLGNRMPIFSAKNIEVANLRSIGKEGKHLKLFLKDKKSQRFFEALLWNYDQRQNLKTKDQIELAFTPKLNEFNGEVNIQLEIKDWNPVSISNNNEIFIANKPHNIKPAQKELEIIDFRNKTIECINHLKDKNSVLYFAEVNQKNYQELKPKSRKNVERSSTLVFIDSAPDEKSFVDIINKVNPETIYLAYSDGEKYSASDLLKKLSGMMRYVENQKNGQVEKVDIECVLGISRTALIFAIEVLVKSGFLSYKQSMNLLNIKISNTSRQISDKLIEYNLFASELKEIYSFKDFLLTSSISKIQSLIPKKGIKHEQGEEISA